MTDNLDGLPKMAAPQTPPAERAPAADVSQRRARSSVATKFRDLTGDGSGGDEPQMALPKSDQVIAPAKQILDPGRPGFDALTAQRDNARLGNQMQQRARVAQAGRSRAEPQLQPKKKGRSPLVPISNWLSNLKNRVSPLISRRQTGGSDGDINENEVDLRPPAPKKKMGGFENPLNKIGAGWQILIVVGLVGGLAIWGLRTYVVTEAPPISVAPPVVTELKPVDVKNVDWIAPMQMTLILASISFFLLVIGDGQKRHQMGDAVAVMIAIFLNYAPSIPWPFGGSLGDILRAIGLPGGMTILFAEIVIVILVSLAGGRDFTPLGGYLALLALGGLLTGSLGEFGVALHLEPAPILPIWQAAELTVLKKVDMVAGSIWVYLLLVAAVGVLTLETIRPAVQEDQSDIKPRMFSVLTVVIGAVLYLVLRLGVHLAPYYGFPIALSVVLGIGAVAQGEKMPTFVPGKWSIRTMFDPAMLFVALFVTFQVMAGIA